MESGKIKLIIQINCYNEADDLHVVFSRIPKEIEGVDVIETLIIDDGSSDNTNEVAKKLGATNIYRNYGNKGVPYSLNRGLYLANKLEADILVNMDADNQHDPKDIGKLIRPILDNEADLVHGERPVSDVEHTSTVKKILQKIGAWAVSVVVGHPVKDASSGYRALNREAMSKITLLYDYAAPLEYIIQAKNKNLNIKFVEITPNEAVRPSKLIKSMSKYVTRSAAVILDNLIVYRSFGVFLTFGFLSFLLGAGSFVLRLYLVNRSSSDDHLTLLILSILFVTIGFQFLFFAVLARLSRANRRLSEEVLYQMNVD